MQMNNTEARQLQLLRRKVALSSSQLFLQDESASPCLTLQRDNTSSSILRRGVLFVERRTQPRGSEGGGLARVL